MWWNVVVPPLPPPLNTPLLQIKITVTLSPPLHAYVVKNNIRKSLPCSWGGGPCGCRQPFVIHSISNLKNPTIPILNVKNPTILISNLKNPTISISTVKNPTISEPVLELYLLNLDLITVQNRLYSVLKTGVQRHRVYVTYENHSRL